MQIDFTEKELAVIELMAPGKSAQVIVNMILRDWFNANVDRMYKQVKPQESMLDDIMAVAAATIAKKEDGPKEAPPVEAKPVAAPAKTPPKGVK